MTAFIFLPLLFFGCDANNELALGRELAYEDIVFKLIDLKSLAKLPDPGERCAQFSSYDKKSKYDFILPILIPPVRLVDGNNCYLLV